MHCTKISPVFVFGGQRSNVKGQGNRGQKRKTAESSPLTVHSKACAVGRKQQAATDDTIAWPPGGDGLRRWENQRMQSSCWLLSFSPIFQHGQFRLRYPANEISIRSISC